VHVCMANKYLLTTYDDGDAALIVNLQILARSFRRLRKYLACTSIGISFHATFSLTLRIVEFIFSRAQQWFVMVREHFTTINLSINIHFNEIICCS